MFSEEHQPNNNSGLVRGVPYQLGPVTNYGELINPEEFLPRRLGGPGYARRFPQYRKIGAGLAVEPSVSVVVPARNEARNLRHVIASIPAWVDEIIIVDGHSTDDTVDVARRLCPEAKIVSQRGLGKGDALQAGFQVCQGEIIVMLDADGSTDGAEIARFVAALMTGADYAKGSRFASGGGSDDLTGTRRCGNRLFSVLVNRMFGTRYTDLCYGYNAFWARHLPTLGFLSASGFEIEAMMNIRAFKAGLRIQEIPSHAHPRVHGESSLRIFRDGWRITKVIVREWLLGYGQNFSHK